MAWDSMAMQLHANLTTPSGAATGLWSSGNCGMVIHSSLSGSLMNVSGYEECQGNITCLTAVFLQRLLEQG